MIRILFSILVFILLTDLSALIVFAQDAQPSADIESIPIFLNMIRVSGIWASFVVIFISWMLLRFTTNLVLKLGGIFTERRLFFNKINAFFRFGIFIGTIIVVVLLSFKISREIIAIIGGTIAVATGFAFKDSMAALIAGVIIMIDRPFHVGDRVGFGGYYGDVVTIGLRSVKLQTLDDSMVTIPNNMFMNEVTVCGNYGVLDMQVMVDFYIGYNQDVHLAYELILEATATSSFVHLPKPISVLVSQVIENNYLALKLRLKAYILDTQFEKAFESDVTLRVLRCFKENRINPPVIHHKAAQHNIEIETDELESAVKMT